MEEDNNHELLTVAEVADYLRVAEQTVRKWLVNGYLPGIRIGRSVRIKRVDVEQLLDTRESTEWSVPEAN